jgi:ATP-dependent RNA helicase DeaD
MKEQFKIRQIEKKIKKKFKQCPIPSGVEICKKQLVRLVDDVTKVEVDHDQIDPLYAEISERLGSLDRPELIKKFLSLEFNRFLEYYKNAPDLNVHNGEKKRPGKKERQRVESANQPNRKLKFTRFFLNVGRRDGIMPQGLIGKIKDVPGVRRIKIGKIEIMRKTALLEADSKFAPQILDAFQHAKINGKSVSIEVARNNYSTRRPKHSGIRHRKGRKFKAAQG